ncbi:MAG: SDR family oxidoreductase [Sedimenticola thiotaurini]|uniref:SDR family oxidoreductase n=1 Tax=Sedimenticola thiotaurini TaxID=1543721 RepID=A0A558DAZ2_9GAMM|nr:MAG: SDR family oxidoreductase [Sedimenticola thiotaurini]
MRVLITGAQGFVGKNLQLCLAERSDVQVVPYTRQDSPARLPELLRHSDIVFHLAGVNRPQTPSEFESGNVDLTRQLADAVAQVKRQYGRVVPVVYTSSIQADLDNPYGQSKCEAEQALFELAKQCNVPVYVFRLPNVFGKWCRPNYNSVVATFSYNIARNLPIQVNDPTALLTLVYVDDVLEKFIEIMEGGVPTPLQGKFVTATPQYQITVGSLAEQLRGFRESRKSLQIDRVGGGLTRALYATYVSYLPVEAFAYSVPQHCDQRGVFVEMLKTVDAGQFSFFTAHPGVTRGGHYHHSKTEKFLVIKGYALFRFRHMQTDEVHELRITGEVSQIVETVPGWTHDITNIGHEDMIVMLWANEIFDKNRPDTFKCPV